jgi:hypothetical protein
MSTTNVKSRQETQEERIALGAMAYRHYMAMKANVNDGDAWSGLAVSLQGMGQTRELQAVLARHALQKLPYQSYIGAMAIVAFKDQPAALSEWLRIMSKSPSLTVQERNMISVMTKEMKQVLQHLEQNRESLDQEFGANLESFSKQPIGLDLLLDKSLDEAVSYVESFLTHETLAIAAVRELGFFPHPRSEKLLRRLCRDENTNPKIQTQAVLSLCWLGSEGNAKLIKFGESHLISLTKSGIPLNMALPKPLQRVYRRVEAWFALQQGLMSWEDYEATGLDELSDPITAALPSSVISIGNILLREAFLHYYPVLPALDDVHVWAQAVVSLLQEIESSDGSEWAYPIPESTPEIEAARQWLLGANPSLMDSDEEDNPEATRE